MGTNMIEFELAFRFYECVNWVKTSGLSLLAVKQGQDFSHVEIGVDDDLKEFGDVAEFCLFVEGMMKSSEWGAKPPITP
jgi:hypothetical protein